MKIKEIKIVNQDESTEIADIGADAQNVDYNNTTVKDELDKLNVTDNLVGADLADLQSQVSGLAEGGPKGVYPTVAALTQADPDHSKIYIVTANGHWYYYNNQWLDGGIYQATGVDNNSINYDKLDNGLKFFINLPLEFGGYSGPNPNTQTSRCHTSNLYPIKDGKRYALTITHKDYLIGWNMYLPDGSYHGQISFHSYGKIWTANQDYNIKLFFRRQDEAELTIEDYKNICNNVVLNGEKILLQTNKETLNNINYSNLDITLQQGIQRGYFANNESFKGLPIFVEMFINNDHEWEVVNSSDPTIYGFTGYDNKTTWNFLSHEKITFTLKKGAQCKAIYYDDDENYLGWSSWTKAETADTTVTFVFPQKGRISFANLTQGVKIKNLEDYIDIDNFIHSPLDIPEPKPEIRPRGTNNFIHFSFDDVTTCLGNLKTNYNTYTSLWEEPFFKFLYDLHQEYGAKFSLYTYQANMDLGNKFKQDFIDSNDWLKIGWHAVSGGGFSPSTSAETVKTQYETFITNAYRITGGLNSIDRIPRLDYFKGTRAQVNALRDAKCGIYGVLTADDDRTQDYLTTAQHDYLLSNNSIIDTINGLYYYRTNFRLDWFVSGFHSNYNYNVPTEDNPYDELVSRYNNPDFANLNNNLIVFTHEWQMNNQMRQWIIDVCRFAQEYGYQWEYIQNKVENIKSLTLLNN